MLDLATLSAEQKEILKEFQNSLDGIRASIITALDAELLALKNQMELRLLLCLPESKEEVR